MRCGFLHTAELHVETFERLLPDMSLHHVVRPELLTRAQAEGAQAVRGEVEALLAELAARAGRVMCTCSTLGALDDGMGRDDVLRIDRPAMAQAAGRGGEALLAVCLESTMAPTQALFEAEAGERKGRMLLCEGAWAAFEAGDMAGYAEAIAATVRAARPEGPVVLAQASMAVAAPLLAEFDVITTPEAAAKALLAG